MAMFKNSHLRLLMKLAGFQRLAPLLEETPDATWIVRPDIPADELKESLDLISRAEFNPPVFDDGVLAEHQLRRKTAPRKKADFDDDDDEEGDLGYEDAILFPAGPSRRAIDGAEAPKKIKRRKRRASEVEPLPDEIVIERQKKRKEREREKAQKIKSEMYVYDSETDEERDQEFYAREAAIRAARTGIPIMEDSQPRKPPKPNSRKRKSEALLMDSSGEEDGALASTQKTQSSHQSEQVVISSDDDSDSEAESDDTPLTSSPRPSSPGGSSNKKRRVREMGDGDEEPEDAVMEDKTRDKDVVADAEEEDDDVPLPTARRPRVKGGFVLDSSDEE
jgi:replication fork protection complex subunit Tof1/Swi1